MSDAFSPIGLDPNQIRLQLSGTWKGQGENGMSEQAFTRMMWQTVLKESLDLKMMGTGEDGFSSSLYGDWIKEGFTSAIAAQLANQHPLPMPGTTSRVTGASPQ
jgi:hypothetical protein